MRRYSIDPGRGFTLCLREHFEAGVFEGQCGGFTRGELACGAALSAYRSQHKTGGEVARMKVPVDGVLGNYYIAGGRGIR